MKSFKKLLLICIFVFSALALTGCVGAEIGVEINKDGSGVINATAGVSKDFYDLLGGDENEAELVFTKNNMEYYGGDETVNFKNIDELNKFFAEESAEAAGEEAEDLVSFIKTNDGGFIFLIDTSIANDIEESEEDTEFSELFKGLEEQAFANITIDFPYAVMTDDEDVKGVTIDGKRLSFDAFKVSKDNPDRILKFVSSPTSDIIANAPGIDDIEAIDKIYNIKDIDVSDMDDDDIVIAPAIQNPFTDVKPEDWFYNAVMAMYASGTVQGIGDNRFAPNDTLTYAEFCQMIAREVTLELGEESGYWAYKAVNSCIEEGIIKNLGEITPENYDKPISREEAIVGMLRAYYPKASADVAGITVPDYDSISEEYREEVLKAYALGITHGTDENGTFLPKDFLTRAEICQLLLNVK